MWLCNFVYGNPNFKKRQQQWREITVSCRSEGEPQLFIGDFNDVLSQEEKVGLHPKPQNQVREFRNFVDHSPLILDLNPVHNVRRSFKFEAFWADHKDCENVVRRGWSKREPNGCEWGRLINKIKSCKDELRKWSKTTFKRADKEIHCLKEELKKLQASDFSEEKQEQMQNIKEKLVNLWSQEEKYWGQRARVKWLRLGDKNTSFFHATTIQRRDRNSIQKLKDASGQWLNSKEEIMEHIVNHFMNLFTSTRRQNFDSTIRKIPKRVTEEMNNELLMEVSDEEVKKAVFSMGSLKAPGPDGLNGLFYHKYWDVISKEVCEAVRSFFKNGYIPECIGETIVVLIPKTKNPESLNQLRPISCCNFIYKILARVIVLRLKGIMEKIISPIQSAFVGGRLIQDNLVIVQEIYHSLNKKGRNGSQDMAVKLDMNKAYDRVEWDFLERVITAFGFHERWVRLVMECVKSANYQFKINGDLSRKVKPQRGLRQGDPLSPYLFILVAEVFPILMEEAQKEDRISGLRIAPTAPTITHLLFADDCIIFAKAKEEEAYQIITVLNEYTEASGQRINLDKSSITFGHQVSIQTRVCIEEILNMSSWESPGKYLGLPAIWGRSLNRALSWIEERILNKLEGWKERLLNQAGKEILIKAVVQAIPSYAMNVIKFPKQFCKRINSRVARFWWATSGKERGIHWKNWNIITKSKIEGGLGFKDLEMQNITHLAKQAWRALENPDAIWIKILQAVYYPKGSFWEAQVGKNSSWIWKSILHGRELLRSKGKWGVGNGSKINIWRDN
ncbi:hypothetical protein Ahy_A06g026507 isoform A [Arachis hypogaea]|uniref:Reverse transcriptase domain-containing protein n=1 Tax=Arachis hypogaea TaxID=3818 RepID=A0A445CKQ6_ARAHY|nr:hypothetical protein Ahy_A06g026507 isoform A [Arachis hypogaea]